MDPPSEGASFSSPELALAFAKQHAVDHGYSLAIYRSRGKGSNRVWSLRCNQGDEATPCSFEVVVRCSNQEQAGSLWHVKVICAEHQGHELRTNLDDGKHGLSDRERQYIEQTLQCKPAVVIDEINKRRREEGEDELNSPKLVWNHRSRLRKTKSVSLRLLEPVHDVVTHHRQDGNEGVLFTYRIALSWAHRLQYVFALRTSNCIVDKQNCVLVQMMGFFPTSTSCPLAFAVVQTDDDASLSWALSQTRSLLARPTLSPAIVLASNSNAMRDAIARVWPKTTAIWDEDQSAASAAQSLRHFGVSSLSHVEGVRLATGKEKSKWLLQIVGEAIRWQQKQIEREAEEVKRQTYEGVRAMADSMTARTLFGLVSHKAIRVVYDATQEARARLAEARSFTLARAMARECTVGLPRRPIDALPSLGPLDTSACTTWANLGLPCQHRLAIILDSNPKATLSLDDIPSFWHLADEEDQPRDEVEEEAARGPGAKRRRTTGLLLLLVAVVVVVVVEKEEEEVVVAQEAEQQRQAQAQPFARITRFSSSPRYHCPQSTAQVIDTGSCLPLSYAAYPASTHVAASSFHPHICASSRRTSIPSISFSARRTSAHSLALLHSFSCTSTTTRIYSSSPSFSEMRLAFSLLPALDGRAHEGWTTPPHPRPPSSQQRFVEPTCIPTHLLFYPHQRLQATPGPSHRL